MGGSAPQGLITQHSKGRFGHHQWTNQLTDVSLVETGIFPNTLTISDSHISKITISSLANCSRPPNYRATISAWVITGKFTQH